MSFVRKLLRVALIILACAAQPIALDACHAACDAARTARIASAPPCHRASVNGPQIGQPPRPCGQDHAVVPADSGAGWPSHPLAFATIPARAPLFDGVALPTVVDSSPDPPAADSQPGSNIPLRV